MNSTQLSPLPLQHGWLKRDQTMFARVLTLFAASLTLFLTGCDSGSANKPYPNKPITLICPWAPGGGTDRMSRFMAQELQQELGVPVVVANKTGGSGAVGHSAGALAKPDGYTITMATFELSTMHWMGISDLTWQNFTPVFMLNGDAAAFLVRKGARFKSLDDLLTYIKENSIPTPAKPNPGKLKMSGTATGGAWDLARAGFLLAAGLPVNSILWVPTQGSAPAIVQLLGGHIDAVCCSLPEAAAQIEAGALVPLVVMAPERLEQFPDVPTAKELGVNWEAVGWRGLALPKDAPTNVVETLSNACQKIVDSDAYKNFMEKNGFAIGIRGPREFAEFLAEQDARWKDVIEAAGYAK